MSAEVESMMYVGEKPWHGLGVEVAGLATSAEALDAAGLNWDVLRNPIYAGAGPNSLISGYKAITRASDGRVLSVMKDSYRPHSPREAFDFFDALVGEKAAMYETAGSLRGGRTIWMLAQLPGEVRLPGTDDVVQKKVLLATSFDGTLRTVVKNTPVRVVCWNTLNGALGSAGEEIAVSHRQSLQPKIEEARRVLGIVSKQYEEFEALAGRLYATRYSDQDMKSLAEALFPANEEGEFSVSALENHGTLQRLFVSGRGQEMVRGTAWAAFNAVTEFTDHLRGTRMTKNAESEGAQRMYSAWFGAGADLKARAMQHIQQLAA